MNKYIAEIFVGKKWKLLSKHNDKDYAIINADVTCNSRKCKGRVIYKEQVVYNCGGDKCLSQQEGK